LHNNPLQLGAEFGVLVLGAALVFVTVLLRDLARASRRASGRQQKFLCLSGLQGLTGFLIMGMMEYTYGHSLGIILLAFTVISPLMDSYSTNSKEAAKADTVDPVLTHQ
jgi:hypothetical protein